MMGEGQGPPRCKRCGCVRPFMGIGCMFLGCDYPSDPRAPNEWDSDGRVHRVEVKTEPPTSVGVGSEFTISKVPNK